MEKKPSNQQRSRKYGGNSSFMDVGQPSRAPRQDEQDNDEEVTGPANRKTTVADGHSTQQGISNRPAKDEHAFQDADQSDSQPSRESVDDGPKQVGGNRGQV